jgi:hypothetical protein
MSDDPIDPRLVESKDELAQFLAKFCRRRDLDRQLVHDVQSIADGWRDRRPARRYRLPRASRPRHGRPESSPSGSKSGRPYRWGFQFQQIPSKKIGPLG